MLSKNIDNLSLAELCDLLVTHTTELLDLLNQKGPTGLLSDKKADVEMIQSVILEKKSKNEDLSVNSLSPVASSKQRRI